ncbi:MAG: nuclear transport factor 2 family protein [Dermatophilaceae bacterium]
MNRASFEDYITRFNAKDLTTFDDYFVPDVRMLNGTLELLGVPAVQEHYRLIWSQFTEALSVERVVMDEDTVAIKMWAHFTALDDNPEALFGPVRKGETFDFRGLIMYWVQNGRFSNIEVAYNTFTFTDSTGRTTELGIPH